MIKLFNKIRALFTVAEPTNSPVFNIAKQYSQLRPIRKDIWVGICPFHEEKTASFSVCVSTNTFHCFGCGASGDSDNLSSLVSNIETPGIFGYFSPQ